MEEGMRYIASITAANYVGNAMAKEVTSLLSAEGNVTVQGVIEYLTKINNDDPNVQESDKAVVQAVNNEMNRAQTHNDLELVIEALDSNDQRRSFEANGRRYFNLPRDDPVVNKFAPETMDGMEYMGLNLLISACEKGGSGYSAPVMKKIDTPLPAYR